MQGLGIGFGLFVFLLLLGGTGWLVWSVNSTDEISKQDKVAAISQPVTTEVIPAPPAEMNTKPVEALPVNETMTVQKQEETIPVVQNEPVEIRALPVPTADTITQTDTIGRANATYTATIEKDTEGLTIVIDAPEDSEIFKPAPDAKPVETITAVITNDSSDTEQPQVPDQSVSDEQVKPVIKTEVVHIVVKGDTLWHIAIRYLNNPYLSPELAKLSNIKNPDLIYPGNRVRIIKRSHRN